MDNETCTIFLAAWRTMSPIIPTLTSHRLYPRLMVGYCCCRNEVSNILWYSRVMADFRNKNQVSSDSVGFIFLYFGSEMVSANEWSVLYLSFQILNFLHGQTVFGCQPKEASHHGCCCDLFSIYRCCSGVID